MTTGRTQAAHLSNMSDEPSRQFLRKE